MRIAWGASIAAQALYASALWHRGQRDWWTTYMIWGVGRSLFLMPFDGVGYWWAWILTEPIDAIIKLSAVWEIASRCERPRYLMTGIGLAVLLCSCSLIIQPVEPLARQAARLLFEFTAYGAVGVAAGSYFSGLAPNLGVIGCLCIDAFRSIAEHFIATRGEVKALNLLYLCVSAMFVSVVALREMNGKPYRHHG